MNIKNDQVIVDHCSLSWGIDGSLDIRDSGRVTAQWNFITQTLNRSGVHDDSDTNGDGVPDNLNAEHGFAGIQNGSGLMQGVGGHVGSKYSLHHNYIAHHKGRMPKPANDESPIDDPAGLLVDYRNNFFYNWGADYSGQNTDRYGQNPDHEDSVSRYDFINNMFKPGDDSTGNTFFKERSPRALACFQGNTLGGTPVNQADHVERVLNPAAPGYTPATDAVYFATLEFAISPDGPVATETATTALSGKILQHAGASIERDAIDDQLDIAAGRIIDSQSQMNGWPSLGAPAPYDDLDGDGLPDSWEDLNQMNKQDSKDAVLDPDGDGYSALEDYLNELTAP